MTAMSGAERQRRYRERHAPLRDDWRNEIIRMLLEIKSDLLALRDAVTKLSPLRDDSRAREYITLKSSTETLPESSLVERPPQRRGTRLPPDFEIPQEWKDEARRVREVAGLPPINLDAEAASFVDFWHSKAGKDGCKLDWRATWRNWCRNARGNKIAAQPAVNGLSPEINELRAKTLAELARKGMHVLPGSMS